MRLDHLVHEIRWSNRTQVVQLEERSNEPAGDPGAPGPVGGAPDRPLRRTTRELVGRRGKSGSRVLLRVHDHAARTGNGVIAPLRDERGAGPGVKDTRRPPF